LTITKLECGKEDIPLNLSYIPLHAWYLQEKKRESKEKAKENQMRERRFSLRPI
jgi:hypothetical protein